MTKTSLRESYFTGGTQVELYTKQNVPYALRTEWVDCVCVCVPSAIKCAHKFCHVWDTHMIKWILRPLTQITRAICFSLTPLSIKRYPKFLFTGQHIFRHLFGSCHVSRWLLQSYLFLASVLFKLHASGYDNTCIWGRQLLLKEVIVLVVLLITCNSLSCN